MVFTKPWDDLVTGYPKLAGRMEHLHEEAIFRRFGALNARNLLYFQAQLVALEEELVRREREDSGQLEKCRFAHDWFWLSQSQLQGSSEQLDLVLKIRATLKEYNDALIQQATVCGLQSPDKLDLKNLQDFLEMEIGPHALLGDDSLVWGSVTDRKSYSPDLVSLRRRERSDPFSGWLGRTTLSAMARYGCVRWKKPSRTHGIVCIHEDGIIVRVTLWITTVFASLIPVASVVMLYIVHSVPARLGMIGIFNFIVSVALSIFTGAKRSEIFAVSAALTAVQVVFVNTNNK